MSLCLRREYKGLRNPGTWRQFRISRTLPLRLNLAVPSPRMGSGVSSPRMANLLLHVLYDINALKSGNMTLVAPESAHASSGSSEVNMHASDDESKACVMLWTRDAIGLGLVDARRADVILLARRLAIFLNLR